MKTVDATALKLLNKSELQAILDCPRDRVESFIKLHIAHFEDLNAKGRRRNYVISLGKLERILNGDIPTPAPATKSKAAPRRRKPSKHYV